MISIDTKLSRNPVIELLTENCARAEQDYESTPNEASRNELAKADLELIGVVEALASRA